MAGNLTIDRGTGALLITDSFSQFIEYLRMVLR